MQELLIEVSHYFLFFLKYIFFFAFFVKIGKGIEWFLYFCHWFFRLKIDFCEFRQRVAAITQVHLNKN